MTSPGSQWQFPPVLNGAPAAVRPVGVRPGQVPGRPGVSTSAASMEGTRHTGPIPAPGGSPAPVGGPGAATTRRLDPAGPATPPVERPELGAGDPEPSSVPAWEVLGAPRRESWWVRARRSAVLVVGAVLVLTGAVTIAGTVRSWVVRGAVPPPAPTVVESEFDAAAVPFAVDYLSWDQNERPSRQMALSRSVVPKVTGDGWDGTGRQWADSPAAVGFVRGGGDRAVVTVRVRVTPFAAAGSTSSAALPVKSDAGPNVASGPVLSSPGWTALQARWVNLAVPLAKRDGRVVVTASPVLVGSPPTGVAGPALPGSSSVGDTAFAQSTQDTLTTLLRSYGTGELDYARASGTSFTGLNQAAMLDSVTAWRVRVLDPGAEGSTRVGDATVTWALSGGAGKLTCSYRVELKNDSGRWYLSSVDAETEVVS